jgi:hypothetical protein
MKVSFLGGLLALGGVLAGAPACLPPPAPAAPLTDTFSVSNYFTPSGYMGDGARLGNLSVEVNKHCKPRPAEARGDCYVFTYKKDQVQADHWAGVYWVFPANNWGVEFGHAIDTAKFQQIRFYAAIEAPMPFTAAGGATDFFNTFAGGIDPAGFYSHMGLQDHRDAVKVTLAATVGKDLTSDLRPFQMALSDFARSANCNLDMPPPAPKMPANCDANGFANDLIGAFGWSVHYPDDADPNGDQSLKIYLDDIVWDTKAP